MFIPEFTITPKILKNIGTVEYSKAIVETTSILHSWETQLKNEALIKSIYSSAQLIGLSTTYDNVKKYVESLNSKVSQEIENIAKTSIIADDIAVNKEFEELDVKYIHAALCKNILPKSRQGVYRATKVPNKLDPEEILAYFVEVFDWCDSLDAKENHPIINSAILRGVFELVEPFESYNDLTADISTYVSLKIGGYNFKDFISLPDYYHKDQVEYEQSLGSISSYDLDFTQWIEYFTEAMAYECSNVKEKVLLLEKDTKIAKVTGRAKLSERQERIVAYLQDYVLLQNKDFPRVFPNISEDTVLRDLKVLIDMGMVVKKGSTKSSRYELA